MDKVHLNTVMEIYMMETGKIMKNVDMDSKFIKNKKQNIRAGGKTILLMEKEI